MKTFKKYILSENSRRNDSRLHRAKTDTPSAVDRTTRLQVQSTQYLHTKEVHLSMLRTLHHNNELPLNVYSLKETLCIFLLLLFESLPKCSCCIEISNFYCSLINVFFSIFVLCFLLLVMVYLHNWYICTVSYN